MEPHLVVHKFQLLNMIKKLDKKIYKPIVFLHNNGILKKFLVREKIDFILDNSIKFHQIIVYLIFFPYQCQIFLRMKKHI